MEKVTILVFNSWLFNNKMNRSLQLYIKSGIHDRSILSATKNEVVSITESLARKNITDGYKIVLKRGRSL